MRGGSALGIATEMKGIAMGSTKVSNKHERERWNPSIMNVSASTWLNGRLPQRRWWKNRPAENKAYWSLEKRKIRSNSHLASTSTQIWTCASQVRSFDYRVVYEHVPLLGVPHLDDFRVIASLQPPTGARFALRASSHSARAGDPQPADSTNHGRERSQLLAYALCELKTAKVSTKAT
jgi:hypothetical protein